MYLYLNVMTSVSNKVVTCSSVYRTDNDKFQPTIVVLKTVGSFSQTPYWFGLEIYLKAGGMGWFERKITCPLPVKLIGYTFENGFSGHQVYF
jgi:hypothetical protein